MNAEIVREGKTGLLAADLAAWERQLSRLIASPGLRQQLGEAGQLTVLRHYSLGTMAPRLADLLGSTLKESAPSRRWNTGQVT